VYGVKIQLKTNNRINTTTQIIKYTVTGPASAAVNARIHRIKNTRNKTDKKAWISMVKSHR